MAKKMIIGSLQSGIGKTTFTLALGLRLKKDGVKVGYFKPITDQPHDADASDAKEILQLKDDLEVICPVMISSFEYDMTDNQKETYISKIKKAFDILDKKYDILLIENCKNMDRLITFQLSLKDLASMFNAKILLLSGGKNVEDIDSLVFANDYLKSQNIEILGSVLTIVPHEIFELYKTIICPKLEDEFGIKIYGLVPEESNLVAPSVDEINSSLNGHILAGRNYVDNLIESYVIGAMEPESALKYFRRALKKCVITGGDRPQVSIAALETDTSVIVLTGGIHPPQSVLAKAEQKKVPVILVNDDTFTTVKKLTDSSLYGKLSINQAEKINAWDKIFEKVDYKSLISRLS